MLHPGTYLSVAGQEVLIEELTTVRRLKKHNCITFANEVQSAILRLLSQEFPEQDFYEIAEKSWGHVVAIGKINDIWKSPIWDWKTGKLISANSGGNWALHDNFNISPDSKQTQ